MDLRVLRQVCGECDQLRLGLRTVAMLHQELAKFLARLATGVFGLVLPDAVNGAVIITKDVGDFPLAHGQAPEFQVYESIFRLSLPQTQQMGAGFFDPAGSQQRLRQSKPVERITLRVKKGRLEIVDGGLRPARLQFSFAPRVPLPGQRLLRLMIAPGGEARHGEEKTQGK